MCGRFVALSDPDGLARFFVVDDRQVEDVPPSWNVAPTDRVAAVAEHAARRTLVAFSWGLVPHWATDRRGASRFINARAETVAEKPAFRDAFARRRCLVPADGFYEWRRGEAGRPQPYFVAPSPAGPLAFAGLWASWRDPREPGVRVLTCTIVTTRANRVVAPLHDRMPVILARDDWDEWLGRDRRDARQLQHLLRPAPEDLLTVRPVSAAVNDVRNNHPGLLQVVSGDDMGAPTQTEEQRWDSSTRP